MSKRNGLKVLLDTSFLLPSLGVDVGEDVAKGLNMLVDSDAEIYYSQFSILEALWVVIGLIKDGTFNSDMFSLGLRSITEGNRYKEAHTDSHTFNEGLKLYRLGHEDIIDNILYATSVSHDLKFLTLDGELQRFIEEHKLQNNLMNQ
ncbi:MAG: PIN domain-containing protein [Candidatus Bathyarchaeia archaeon]